jgi:glyoxylase-like metal-dependent hydrolase (beta-lactamase superfamily II)
VLRTLLAPNASPLTLDGTRTYLVGRDRVVVIDPGSDAANHQDALVGLVAGAAVTAVVVTHDHPDHLSGAVPLGERLDAPVRLRSRRSLRDGDRLDTDAGELVAVATPGHTPDHMALHWPAEDAVFCGDLLMGGQDSALVAPPEGRLGPYLASLDRIRRLLPRAIYPAHGPPILNPEATLDRYVRHRRERLERVLSSLRAGATDPESLLDGVYGSELAEPLRPAARAALRAYLEFLQAMGQVRRLGHGWEVVEP